MRAHVQVHASSSNDATSGARVASSIFGECLRSHQLQQRIRAHKLLRWSPGNNFEHNKRLQGIASSEFESNGRLRASSSSIFEPSWWLRALSSSIFMTAPSKVRAMNSSVVLDNTMFSCCTEPKASKACNDCMSPRGILISDDT